MLSISYLDIKESDPSKLEIRLVDGNVDFSDFSNLLRYAVVGSKEVFHLNLNVFDLIDIPSNELVSSNKNRNIELIKSKISNIIRDGYLFRFQISELVEGAKTMYSDKYIIADNDIVSIGFGGSEGEARKDAYNRILRIISRRYYKGIIYFDVKIDKLPLDKDLDIVEGKEYRNYFLKVYSDKRI